MADLSLEEPAPQNNSIPTIGRCGPIKKTVRQFGSWKRSSHELRIRPGSAGQGLSVLENRENERASTGCWRGQIFCAIEWNYPFKNSRSATVRICDLRFISIQCSVCLCVSLSPRSTASRNMRAEGFIYKLHHKRNGVPFTPQICSL